MGRATDRQIEQLRASVLDNCSVSDYDWFKAMQAELEHRRAADLNETEREELAADGLKARRNAIDRLCALGRELDGAAFDGDSLRAALEGKPLDEIRIRLRDYEVRFDAKYSLRDFAADLNESERGELDLLRVSVVGGVQFICPSCGATAMTAPEIRKLAEDYLALPPGPYRITPSSQESEQYWIVVGRDGKGEEIDYFEGWRAQAEAEARRLNAMPGLLRAWFLNSFNWIHQSEHASLRTLIARCEAHQKGEIA